MIWCHIYICWHLQSEGHNLQERLCAPDSNQQDFWAEIWRIFILSINEPSVIFFETKVCVKLTPPPSLVTGLIFVQSLMINWTFCCCFGELALAGWERLLRPQPPSRVFTGEVGESFKVALVEKFHKVIRWKTRSEASSWPQFWAFYHRRCHLVRNQWIHLL